MPSSIHKLNVGIIGYGVVGKKRHSILKKYKQLKVIAASDVNDQSLLGLPKNVQTFNDYRKLINESNCNIVFISVPNRFAAEATKLALRKGIHVFCEKPPARSSRELSSIKNLIQGKKN
jgi:predicted dehydrogenase